jgi:hypothetical protein
MGPFFVGIGTVSRHCHGNDTARAQGNGDADRGPDLQPEMDVAEPLLGTGKTDYRALKAMLGEGGT